MLASRDGWEDGSDVELWERDRCFVYWDYSRQIIRLNDKSRIIRQEGSKIYSGRNPAREQKRIPGQNLVRKL